MENRWIAIYNPFSGYKNSKCTKEYITNQFDKHNIKYHLSTTKNIGDINNIVTSRLEEGYKNFIAIDGDGTVHDIINAILTQDKIKSNQVFLAVIPRGTGNDWARNLNLTHKNIFKSIKSKNHTLHDIGVVEYQGLNSPKIAYFLNEIGVGFNAKVCQHADKKKSNYNNPIIKKITYLKSVISTAHKNKIQDCTIKYNNQTYNTTLFTLGAGIGRFAGKGMKLFPKADINDGLLDVMMLEKINYPSIIKNLYRLYLGNLHQYKRIKYFKTSSLEITSSNPLPIETDGEVIGHTPAKIGIIKNAINIIR